MKIQGVRQGKLLEAGFTEMFNRSSSFLCLRVKKEMGENIGKRALERLLVCFTFYPLQRINSKENK